MNYYRRYLGDYMRDTMHLSMLEHGAYNLLLDAQYATDKPLPASIEALYRLCRAMSKAEQEAVRSVVDQFFPVDGEGRWNARAKREVGIAQATISKQIQSGVESASKRWSTDRSTHESTYGSAIQPPTTNHQPPTTSLQPPPSKERKAKSGKPDAGPPRAPNGHDFTATARSVLAFLNDKTGRRYQPVPANLNRIAARLKEGATEQELRQVVALKCREWSTDERMAIYLRPATLFNAEKFAQYQGELGRDD